MSFLNSKLFFISSAFALSLMAGTAGATPISLVYDGPSTGDRQTVSIDDAPVAPWSGDWSKTVYAYGFNMTDTSGVLGSFLAWCVDVGSYLSTSQTNARPYTITDDPFSNSWSLDTDGMARVQSMFDANYAGVDTANGVQAAAFQLALWNAVYDDDGDVETGAFRASASNQSILDLANDYLGAANTYGGGKAYVLSFLESTPKPGTNQNKYQNLVTVSAVPIPAAGGLLLLAISGLGAVARKRKTT